MPSLSRSAPQLLSTFCFASKPRTRTRANCCILLGLDELSTCDRGLTTEIVMGVLRWRSRLDESIAAAFVAAAQQARHRGTHRASHRGLSIAILDACSGFSGYQRKRRTGQARAQNIRRALCKCRSAQVGKYTTGLHARRNWRHRRRALRASTRIPQWLVERWVEQFGIENAFRICQQDQFEPAPSLRFEDPAAEADLIADGIQLAPGGMLTSARLLMGQVSDLTRTAAFRDGRVVIQDEASQLVALLVGTGTRLLDCCAAPGGKTAVLAARNPPLKSSPSNCTLIVPTFCASVCAPPT